MFLAQRSEESSETDVEYDMIYEDSADEVDSYASNTYLAQTQVKPLNIFVRTNFMEIWISQDLRFVCFSF